MKSKENSLEKVTATKDRPIGKYVASQPNRKPTIRQKLLVARLVENKGNVSKSMREVGYSAKHAKNPQQITSSPTFQALLDEFLPEQHLSQKHREFLDAKKIIRTYVKGDLKETTEETDGNAVKALDMAYKLRGKYADKTGNNILIINVSKESADRYRTPSDDAPSS